jgi:hypothetical protein
MDKGAKKKLNPTIKSSLIYTKPNRKNKTKINTYIKSSLTVEKPVSHQVATRPTFSSLLLFWIIMLAILPATMLRYYSMNASSMPSNFFFIVSIYWKLASYRSSLDLSSFGKDFKRVGWKVDLFFFFWTDVHAIRPVDSSTTSS